MLRSDSSDYSDAYIVVKGEITVANSNNAKRRNKKLTFTNTAPLRYAYQESITHSLAMHMVTTQISNLNSRTFLSFFQDKIKTNSRTFPGQITF